MATISRQNFNDNGTEIGVPTPILYVDSMNYSSFAAEMYSYTTRSIREQLGKDYNGEPVIREEHMAKDENDIYHNKTDGYWIVCDEEKKILSLYKRETSVGNIYNSVYVTKTYTLTCTECPRIVPKVFKETTIFEDFTSELKKTVRSYRTRTDSLNN